MLWSNALNWNIHLYTRASSSLQKAGHERLKGRVESFEALALVRGGGGSDEASVFTLFVRVFLPTFGRESKAKDEGLDLEGGGLLRRLSRLVSGVLRIVPGFSRDPDTKGERAEVLGFLWRRCSLRRKLALYTTPRRPLYRDASVATNTL